jgi:hypothetical protein
MWINARRCLLILPFLLCTAAVSARQHGPAAQPGSGRIVLDVVVTPKSGQPVSGLQQQDFTVLDNKVPQALTAFQAVDGRQAQVEVILVPSLPIQAPKLRIASQATVTHSAPRSINTP